ncbi:MAG: hypothetical protein OEY70_14295 [Acidimicrobiia bacterium]|nr:hypothetical protein [Acidimicrobiia bacterium]
MIFTVTVLLIRVAWWLLVVWFRLFHALGLLAARSIRRARTRRALRVGPPPVVSWEWWHAAGGALAALAHIATPADAARALRRVNPQPEVVVALHHLATAEGVSVDLAAWSLAVADALTKPAEAEVTTW